MSTHTPENEHHTWQHSPQGLSADPLLVWNYGVMGVLAGVSAVIFWIHVRKLDGKEDELNNLAEGQFGSKAE